MCDKWLSWNRVKHAVPDFFFIFAITFLFILWGQAETWWECSVNMCESWVQRIAWYWNIIFCNLNFCENQAGYKITKANQTKSKNFFNKSFLKSKMMKVHIKALFCATNGCGVTRKNRFSGKIGKILKFEILTTFFEF